MVPTSTRIFVCTEPVDMRCSFAGLARCTREVLQQDPSSGALFIFAGKRGDSIKALWWDKTGYCILYNQASSHYTSFDLVRTLLVFVGCCRLAARSISRFQRLHCLVGGFGPGSS
jgi:transposase